MATQNKRIVGYLPSDYHRRLRQFMDEQGLSESAALVQIVKEFFDGKQSNPEIETLKSQIAQLQQRMAVVEGVLAAASGRGRSKQSGYGMPMVEPVQRKELTAAQLAERLKVSEAEVEEAASQGTEHFRKWSKSHDPALLVWENRGGLFSKVER